ncbi:hypothetical protein D3C87_1683060 [compost metagenome]
MLATIVICFPAVAAAFKAAITVLSNLDHSTSCPFIWAVFNLDSSYKSKTDAAVPESVP